MLRLLVLMLSHLIVMPRLVGLMTNRSVLVMIPMVLMLKLFPGVLDH